MHPAWVSELFSQLAFKAGLPPIRLHDLRHCAATLAYAAGADTKMVSSMLRHSSTNLTENTYTTVLPELAHEAAEATAAIVPRGVSQTGGLPSVSQGGASDAADSGGEVTPLVKALESGRAPGARTRNLRIKSGRSIFGTLRLRPWVSCRRPGRLLGAIRTCSGSCFTGPPPFSTHSTLIERPVPHSAISHVPR
ncbi:tyrosine-type recombinase/integrase [Nonomuraea maritima]|uniref:tyrosine-type recombinase/integrase n=1 Tax=Nonomuraea maritima TaxID=683260 RepID=UPI00159FBD0D